MLYVVQPIALMNGSDIGWKRMEEIRITSKFGS